MLGMIRMTNQSPCRRDLLRAVLAFGVAGLAKPTGASTRQSAVGRLAGAQSRGPRYDPSAKFDVVLTDVDFRRNSAGRMLRAHIYEPIGNGPFPAVLDLHGGAWNLRSRGGAPMGRALAATGVLVVSVDMTVSSEAPYPACVQDANYGVRWLKWHAPRWHGDGSNIGVYGSSSGGHVAELLAMRPGDQRYNAFKLREAPGIDATVAYLVMRSPISDPYARFKNAETLHRDDMVRNHTLFFQPWDSIHEGNPQEILDRHEPVKMVPVLIMQGAADDNMLPTVQEKFVSAYKAAGGFCEYHLFEGVGYDWLDRPGPQAERAREVVKAFIARRVNAR